MEEKETKKIEEVEEKQAKPVEIKRLVGIQFSPAGKVYSFVAGNLHIHLHDLVVVEGDKGPIIGQVSVPLFEKKSNEVATNIRKVIRKADEKDAERYQANREKAMNAYNLCKEKIVEHGLSMKLVDVDVLTGDAKAIFYFTAEERVDFRSLVKDLASSLHMRIEMRQIGARDATKSIGGLGSCGQVCCCAKHLREFKSIAIQMAKNQGLSPNPTKLTGMCGKLKCCLLYENEMYSKLKRKLPTIGSEVETSSGIGFITGLDIPRQIVTVRLPESNKDLRLNVDEIKVLKKKEPRKRAKREKKDQKDKSKKGK